MKSLNNLRICVLKESLAIGGNERSAANVSRILSSKYNTYFAVYDSSNMQYRYGGELIDLNLPPQKGLFLKVLNSFLRLKRFKKEIKKKNIDIVYQFTSISNYMNCINNKRFINIVSARDFGKMQKDIQRFKKVLDGADAMICNSLYLRDYYLKYYPEDKDKVFTIYNMIDEEEINILSKEPVEINYKEFLVKHKMNIVSVGRFCKEKGFENLIKSFAYVKNSIPGVGLVLIGEGEYRDIYESLIGKLDMKEDVYFAGYTNNPYKYMKCCDVFVLSSVSEGFPNVLAEAMVLGIPVVSTNCYSGPAEILMEEADYEKVANELYVADYGILVPGYIDNDDTVVISQMANAISYYLNNENIREKFAALSKNRVKNYSKRNILQDLDSIFSLLVYRREHNDKK